MLKRLFIIAVALALSASYLSACSKSNSESSSDGSTSDASVVAEESTSDGDPTSPLKIKVGYIYNRSVDSGDTLVASFEKSRYELQQLLGVETCYIDSVLVQQFQDAVEIMRDNDVNVIIAASSFFASSVNKAAKQEDNPEVVYIGYDGAPRNLNESVFKPMIYEASNILGLVAGFNTTANKVGIVADNNLFAARAVINAFSLGIQDVPVSNLFTEISLAWALSSSIPNSRRAVDSLINKGCDIIFVYQTSPDTIKYCERKGVKVIGFASNIPELAPTQYLSGFYLNTNSYIVNVAQHVRRRSFSGSQNVSGIANGMVGLIQLNPETTRAGTSQLINTQSEFIKSKKNPIFAGEIRDRNDVVKVDKGIILNQAQIFNLDWIEKHIISEENFSPPLTDANLVHSDLKIKK